MSKRDALVRMALRKAGVRLREALLAALYYVPKEWTARETQLACLAALAETDGDK